MKIRCTTDNFLKLNNELTITRLKEYLHFEDGKLDLIKGCDYTVFGIVILDNCPWYYLYLNKDDESPTPYPAELFEVIDAELSIYWKLSYVNKDNFIHTEFVFPEWANDRYLLERLLDGNPVVLELFNKYRKLII